MIEGALSFFCLDTLSLCFDLFGIFVVLSFGMLHLPFFSFDHLSRIISISGDGKVAVLCN